jgi:ParB family chromosome partitioning protein
MSDSDPRSNLGRGLAALLGEAVEAPAGDSAGRTAKEVPVGQLHPNPWQPRQIFDDEAVRELADSIRENGVLQPILARRHPQRPGEFEIVAGERRWRAAQLAQLHLVPIVVRELSDLQTLELALVENVQREDLNALEEAEAYRRLIDEFGNSQEALAKAVGKSRSHVANTLRLLALPASVKTLLAGGQLSAGHARAVLGVKDPEAVARRIVDDGLSVRQTEALTKPEKAKSRPGEPDAGDGEHANDGLAGWVSSGGGTAVSGASDGAGAPRAKDPDTAALERDLSALLGLKVSIDFDADGGGRLSVRYRTVEQLDDLLHRLDHTRRNSGP